MSRVAHAAVFVLSPGGEVAGQVMRGSARESSRSRVRARAIGDQGGGNPWVVRPLPTTSMKTTTSLATLGALAATAAPALALFGALPILSTFDSDLPGAPPSTGGSNQPDVLYVPLGGSLLVQASAYGLDDQPVVLFDDDGEYVSLDYHHPASVDSMRFEATVSFSDLTSGYFMQTASPSGSVLARLRMGLDGHIRAGGVDIGRYTAGVPQRYRIDTDMLSGTWSVAIDAELDGFADDPAVFGISPVNQGEIEVGIAMASLNASGAAASVAYDDIYIGRAEIGTLFCFGDGSAQPCPCGNASAAGEGCANSSGQGATARVDGSTSATLDDVIVYGTQLPPNQPALLFGAVNANPIGVTFGDGLRCAVSSAIRLQEGTADAGGEIQYGPGLGAIGGWSQGDTRRMQIWYRDPSGPCGSGFNMSNAIELSFTL